ncbi:BnaC04g49610D [Brassica napus]|uniref:BnaC04g49610D protein n=1 Tax=Brassica napus TaxID=3708 RepID=A0A078GFM7_BRANA|nr:BnaC04g49610D [Brassica napus]
MGRPKPEDSIRHFSHPHPLFNSSLNPQANSSSSSCVEGYSDVTHAEKMVMDSLITAETAE